MSQTRTDSAVPHHARSNPSAHHRSSPESRRNRLQFYCLQFFPPWPSASVPPVDAIIVSGQSLCRARLRVTTSATGQNEPCDSLRRHGRSTSESGRGGRAALPSRARSRSGQRYSITLSAVASRAGGTVREGLPSRRCDLSAQMVGIWDRTSRAKSHGHTSITAPS